MKILKNLCEAFGPSGCENDVSEIIKKEMENSSFDVTKDTIGNLICHKKGSGKKVMLLASMDESGLIVTHIEDDGRLRVRGVGEYPSCNFLPCYVKFRNGTKGIVWAEKGEHDKTSLQDAFVDIGAKNKDEAEKYVSIGSLAVFDGSFCEIGNMVSGKAIKSRVACYALIEAAKNIDSDNDLYFVFTSQGEVGGRGAQCVPVNINPEYALSVEGSLADDNSQKDGIKLYGGVVIKVKDKSLITDYEVREKLIELASSKNYQLKVSGEGRSDASVIQNALFGIKTGALEIPLRYIPSSLGAAAKSDIESAIDLIRDFIKA